MQRELSCLLFTSHFIILSFKYVVCRKYALVFRGNYRNTQVNAINHSEKLTPVLYLLTLNQISVNSL